MKIQLIIRFTLICLFFLITTEAAHARDNRISLHINGHTIRAEVARTQEERSKGLMNRRHMGKNDGMLFVFEQPQTVSMWMKNTLLPLSVAFIDDQGRIINIAEMLPETLTTHSSLSPAKYALEMNAGWFEKNKILAGKSVEGIEAAQNKNAATKPAN
ncbi:MAG: hypothetical protein RL020_2188 [Pseudomonadota bacterium]|jgi:uncharacterized membrane protein (UPF0127 family)